MRELPRKGSIFELVLAADGPVVAPDVSKHPCFASCGLIIRRLEVGSFASVPSVPATGKFWAFSPSSGASLAGRWLQKNCTCWRAWPIS
ncbi:MAG: GAF domain-containing protein [Terracidiphilus sp.]